MIENLGDFGKITQAAHAAGGVGKLLDSVGAKAVAKASPRLRSEGLIAGVVLGVAGAAAFRFMTNRKAAIAEGDEAEAEIHRIAADAGETEAPTDAVTPEEPRTE